VYQGLSSSERRTAHLALADALTDEVESDQRAWHRAAAALGTDDDVAAELENTADRARQRSGHAAAEAALERAAELSADQESKGRRLVRAARAAWQGGRPDQALALLDRADPMASDPLLRAEAEHVRGVVELRCGSLLDAGERLMTGAVRVAPVDPGKAFEMLVDAGSVAGRSGDVVRMVEIGRLINDLPRNGDEMEAVLTDLLVGVGHLIEGTTAVNVPLILEAIERAADFDDPRLLSWAATGASTVGDEAAETALLRRALEVARTAGAVDTLVLILETVVSSALLSGRFTIESEATEGLRLATEAGMPNAASAHLATLAWIAGLRGREDECRELAAEVTASVRTSAMANANSIAEWGVAMLELSIGQPEATIARLTALAVAPRGIAQPFLVLMATPDLVEACVRAGRHEQAQEAFAALERFAQSGAPLWARAFAARCRALLARDTAATEHEFAEALALYTGGSRPFDKARTELLLGEHLRRERRRVDAREHLRAALVAFESLGAAPWADRARSELRASGETARRHDPSTVDELTPQELQISRLVAEGHTNKEIAAQLFLSPRTIDAHLRNVFAKLGVTSRTQLARLPLGADDAGAQPAAV
jgi:DNA-binding NarL/FixJ family response regulator